jgi:IS30 family transposase
MELRQRDELSIKEIAHVLGVPIGTLKAQLARGRVKLTQRVRKAITASRKPEERQRMSTDGKQVMPMVMNSASETPYLRATSLLKVK